ncbi:MAG: ATP-binding cassette domain-containing protein [Pseudotabrizicola sp.]|uniref:thiamine ABC transporter ATP-binding protein n=1 Tax=Pseudotabrizicola sp. TaxID=2939647 RepID=UPI00272FD0B6|nr:ATP-binding cassette domain-containing protein [Pseudotabrizicola sp.]MDP2083284.1 ATP-binding cassette domain-containing protein [Pseudotabrizicola sp.]MDZ7575913.1 ATP-binding cassette domain-containing protein [Pseudotabrizicola sp.]
MLQFDDVLLAQDDFRLTVDWSVGAGARVAVIGPSGAGKSTLLSAVAGFFAPRRGRVLWQGADLGPLNPGARPVTILFQDQNLFPHLTLALNLGLGLRPDLRLSAAQKAQVDTVLDRVGLAGMGARKPPQLSGGQIGRASLARALLRARPVLLLDEPFAALGPALKAEMLTLVGEIADETGALVMMVTHDPADARAFAALTVLVAEGVAHAPVETAVLFADPPPALRAYLG